MNEILITLILGWLFTGFVHSFLVLQTTFPKRHFIKLLLGALIGSIGGIFVGILSEYDRRELRDSLTSLLKKDKSE